MHQYVSVSAFPLSWILDKIKQIWRPQSTAQTTGAGSCADDVFSPVSTAVELSQSSVSCLWMESIHILCNQPVQLAALLPPLQGHVRTVWLMWGELRPPDEVSGPVALTGLRAADKLYMLHGSSVSASIQPDTLWAVIWDAGLCGESCSADDKQAPGSGHKVLHQLQGLSISGAAGGDKVQHTCGDWGSPPSRCCVQCEDPPWQSHLQQDRHSTDEYKSHIS